MTAREGPVQDGSNGRAERLSPPRCGLEHLSPPPRISPLYRRVERGFDCPGVLARVGLGLSHSRKYALPLIG